MIPKVTNLEKTVGDRQVALSWSVTTAEELVGFYVFVDGVTVAELPATARNYVVSGLVNEREYAIGVKAIIPTSPAAVVKAIPLAPVPPPTESISITLSDDLKGVVVGAAPAGTAKVHWAAMQDINHTGTIYSGTASWPDSDFPLVAPLVPPSGKPVVSALARNAAGADLGKWSSLVQVRPETEPEKEKPPPSIVNLCLPGVCLNGGESLPTRAGKAKALGAKVLRIEGTLDALATAALEAGAKAAPIITGNAPVAEWDKLDSAHKAAIIALCGKNETWPGGIGTKMSGKAYGEWFIGRAKELEGRVPVTLQVNLSPYKDTSGKYLSNMWMEELVRVSGLAAALKGNFLDHHPYGLSMMAKLANPSNPLDQTHGWESRRWMSEAWYVQKMLGIAVPSCLTELGNNLQKVGTWKGVVEMDKAIFQFLGMVKKGTVPITERPDPSYTPVCVFMTHYSLLGNRAGYETFGIDFYDSEGGHNEEAGRWREWQAGAAALLAA